MYPSTLIILVHSGKADPEVGVLVRKKRKDKNLIYLIFTKKAEA